MREIHFYVERETALTRVVIELDLISDGSRSSFLLLERNADAHVKIHNKATACTSFLNSSYGSSLAN